MFVFCGFHLDWEERAACFTLSVLLVSCDYLCSVDFILMGKRELLALLLVSYWSLVTVCVCGLHLDEEETAACITLSHWSLVTFCVLLLSS